MSARGFLLAAMLAALLFVVGCGGSDSKEVTVRTGSLSKAEFVKRADAICEAARSEFLAKYTKFFKAHESDFGNKDKEKEFISQVLESLMAPNVEGQVETISELGSPKAYAPEVASFLNALQKKLDEMRKEPSQLSATPFPFKTAEDIAAKVGLHGCAESFS